MQVDATDPQSLLTFATVAEENLVKLASGLAQHGAQSSTIAQLHQMGDVLRQIGHQIGAAATNAAGQQQAAPAPQQAAPPPVQPRTMDAATQHLHEAMMASAAMRQQPQGGVPPR